MLSKYARIEISREPIVFKAHTITYANLMNDINLIPFTKDELKLITRQYKLALSGNKSTVINTIKTHFRKVSNAIKIQQMVRGHFVRQSMKARGAALKNRSLCVNDSDFYTLDPMNEIPTESFFSYTDNGGFIYGFNLKSLQLLFKKSKMINPYNRQLFDLATLKKMTYLMRITQLLHPEPHANIVVAPTVVEPSAHVTAARQKLIAIRALTVNVRIQELFMEIDLLGNYTNSDWFSSLSKLYYARLYHFIYELWTTQAQLSPQMKYNICPVSNPFANTLPNATVGFNALTIEELQIACLSIIENLVYTGVDIEYRKLGAMHALTALTMVSLPARESMRWLYESIRT